MPRHRVLLTAALVAGCAAPPATSEAPAAAEPAGRPTLSVSVDALDLGAVAVGEAAWATARARNDGDGPLALLAPRISGDGPWWVEGAGTTTLQPGEAVDVQVGVAPGRDGPLRAALVLESNDPADPEQRVALSAEGLGPVAQLTPTQADLGIVPLGCTTTMALSLDNPGAAPLAVGDASLHAASPAFSLDGAPPEAVAPGASAPLTVRFTPQTDGPDAAWLQLFTDDPDQPLVRAHLTATGVATWVTDRFDLPARPQADVWLFVDRSGTMGSQQPALEAAAAALVEAMRAAQGDVRAAAFVTDDGCVAAETPWLDADTALGDAEEVMAKMLDGPWGNHTERAFSMMEAVLQQTDPGGCSADLRRPEAALHLVGVSDEPEQSVYDYTHYLPVFESYAPAPDALVVHGVGGPLPAGCGNMQAYTGVAEATVATGGTFTSLCGIDWAATMAQLVEATQTRPSVFALSGAPVVDTLQVSLDGVPAASGWSWDAAQRAVVFDVAAAPGPGAVVQVTYAAATSCDR